MSIQQFCLRWNNHQPNFISVFTTLLNTESLVDVTLAAEGKHLQAHKVVLSACSVYFQTLFTANPSRHPIVILKDVKYADLRIMVDFMYYGEVNVSQEQLPQILETAKMLKIKGLTEMPESTSLTKSQTNAEQMQAPESWEQQQRHSISPCNLSPSVKKKRVRKSSSGSMERGMEDKVYDNTGASLNLVKSDCITLSSTMPQARRKEQYQEYHKDTTDENGALDAANMQQAADEAANCMMRTVDQTLEEQAAQNMTHQGGQWSMMEHGYGRYNCIGTLQQDASVAFNVNPMIHPHMNVEMCEYGGQGGGQGAGSAGGGPVHQEAVQPAEPPPLQPAPQKRRRATNPQSEENFQRALEAVRFGGIGFCKAARMFGVNNRTLWLEYKKKGYPNNRPSIKNRIKQEHSSPPPQECKEDQQPEQQVLVCQPHPVPVMGFIDSRPVDFPLQGVAHNSPINLHSMNFSSMQ